MAALDFALGEMADTIRDTTARFAADRIAPIAAAIDAEDRFPVELWPEMGALGLHGITVDEADGGLGLGYLEHVVAVEEVSRASASVGLSYGAHSNLCVNQIRRWGSPKQKARHLPGLISGAHVGSLAMSEVAAGSDVVSMKLRADKVAGGFRLNGTKFWITNAAYAETLVVYAKTTPEAGSKGITAFLIERGMAGFSIGQKIDKLGMRGSPTAELVFDDCFVPDEAVMGPLDGGVRVLMSGLDYERVVLSGIQIGIMQACLDVVLPYLRERRQFGRAIGEFQLMQGKVADMAVALSTSRAYVYAVARACDAGRTTRHDAAGAILYASECAVRVAGEAIQALGGAGYTKDWPVERLFRDAKLLDIGAGTNEVRRMLIVNTASKCGFTPQYEGLEKLHEDYGARGLAVLGFPCNQFGAQEPGDAAEIASFCSLTYDVRFPVFAKIDVNGPTAHPLFAFLKDKARGLFGSRRIKWNFTKFLVDRDGNVVARYGPATKPDKLRSAIEKLL